MKKIILLCLALSGCTSACMSTQDCHNMCYPRTVAKFDKDGCYCEDGKKVP